MDYDCDLNFKYLDYICSVKLFETTRPLTEELERPFRAAP